MAVIDAGSAPLPGIKPPSWLLALTEGGRAVADYVSLQGASPLLGYAPTGDGHPVMVLPGFLAAGGTTAPIRRFLVSKGYETFCWGLGRNLGPLAIGPEGELLGQRLENETKVKLGHHAFYGESCDAILRSSSNEATLQITIRT